MPRVEEADIKKRKERMRHYPKDEHMKFFEVGAKQSCPQFVAYGGIDQNAPIKTPGSFSLMNTNIRLNLLFVKSLLFNEQNIGLPRKLFKLLNNE